MSPERRLGYSLVELLVVLSILSLLISLLLPAMSTSQRTAQRLGCMTNLREIATGATQYAMISNDSIIGSPSGSGAYLLDSNQAYGRAVQVWDFMGPMASMWDLGILEPSLGDTGGVAARFNNLRSARSFLCPANTFMARHFTGPDAGTGRMVSYNTVRTQLWRARPGIAGVTSIPPSRPESLPTNWIPSLGRIGNPANKVFCADGARFSSPNITPDYDLSVAAPFGGAFADVGSYSSITRSWNRSWANGLQSGIDARIYAFRHSPAEPPPGAPGNAFKLNLAFYDGHVETQGDLDSTDPHQWLPQGSTLDTSSTWSDTIDYFNLPAKLNIGS
ncbi:MAG: prepilin-type N-terminal cleavage/methylation domain-containing protein [Phycisphaerales bacterium]|nr:prepilin-type N-terminal cleavage/methylation domain-containing protein [Phycisphaerales bacterium]